MGKVIPFQRTRLRRPAAVRAHRGVGGASWAWWMVGAAAAAGAAVLSPLRWPARILLVLVGGVGIVGAVACYWLSSPPNWSMIRLAIAAFLGSVALWHGGDAALKGSKALSVYSFDRAKQLHGKQDGIQ